MKHNINKLFFLSALFLLLPGCVSNKTNTDNKECKVDSDVIEHEHTFSDIWSYDEDYHWHASTCGHTDVVKDKAFHSFGDLIVDEEPTKENPGTGHKICRVCNFYLSLAIGPLEHSHNYGNPTYVWTEDNSHCTAIRVCQKDETHIETETVETVLDIVTEVTDSVDGLYRYTATFTNKAFETQIKDIVVPATGKVSYDLNDDEQGYTAKASNSDIEGTISIPATHNGLPVTDVGDFKNTKITSVVIADGVTKIDNSAFYQCKQLETVTMPDSIVEIGSSAFYYCSALKDPILSKSLKILGSNSFVACGKIENFVIPASIEEIRGQFLTSNNNTKLSIVVEDVEDFLAIDGKNNIGNDIHLIDKDGKEIEELVIPNGVDELASYSLYRLPFIKKVILPEGLTTIGIRAFKYMRSLCNIDRKSVV